MADMMSAMAGMMGSGLPQAATEIPTDEVKDKENVEETKEEDTTSKIQ